MCGAHQKSGMSITSNKGSPPHVRGPQDGDYWFYKEKGITPACAGTTAWYSIGMPATGDHPRMCGDH